MTFKRRIGAFWNWYSAVADRFHRTIDEGACASLSDEVSAKVDELLPGLAWVFGPGAGGQGHSFTLSGEGILPKQILAAAWRDGAPDLAGWTFHSERQPSDQIGAFELRIREHSFRPIEFWVTPEIDEEAEAVNLTVWHPLAEQVSEALRGTALFLMLDELFGEVGTGNWIGTIDYGNARLADSMPILELKEFVESARQEHGWKKGPPGESWHLYQLPEPHEGPRGDTISGVSSCPAPLYAFLRDPQHAEDPFEELDAVWAYLSFDSGFLTQGREVDSREDIAEAIAGDLREQHEGRYLGGGIGRERTYLDFVLFDSPRSEETIRATVRRLGLPPNTRLEYLSAARRRKGRAW